MPKKQVIVNETAVAAPPARAAKPKTPRVRAAQHSKAVPTERPENPNEAIAQLAYSYWESRGRQGGAAIEDWVRAEHEYRQRLAKTF